MLKAYSLLSSDQASARQGSIPVLEAISVGKELLRHISESENQCFIGSETPLRFIVAVSRQCMLAYSSQNASPDWHKRAQLRELCKSLARHLSIWKRSSLRI